MPGKKELEGCLMGRVMQPFWSWRAVRVAHQSERMERHGTGHLEAVKMVIFVLCGFCHNYLKVLNTHTLMWKLR